MAAILAWTLTQVQVEDAIYEDMEQRFRQLQKRLSDLKIENEEVNRIAGVNIRILTTYIQINGIRSLRRNTCVNCNWEISRVDPIVSQLIFFSGLKAHGAQIVFTYKNLVTSPIQCCTLA